MKVLIVTVGGSPQPIITAVQTLKPDRVIFICSDGPKGSKSQVIGEGTPCKIFNSGKIDRELPNLPTHLKLENRFDINQDLVFINNPDDPSECYQKVNRTIKHLLNDKNIREITADYTGGTKTMSLALGMASMDYGIKLYITTSSSRHNLKGVEWGETTEMASTSFIDVERKIDGFLSVFLCQFNYPAAIANLESLLTSVVLPSESKKRVRNWLDFCKSLEAWDRFEHTEAFRLLQNLMYVPEVQILGLFLKRIMKSRSDIDFDYQSSETIQGHGYEIVEDLILNAERRALQKRYDDAVARLYRALELFAQIRLLKQFDIKTGDVDTEKLPNALKVIYKKKRDSDKSIKIGLRESYELLAEFPNEPLGQLYKKECKHLMDSLSTRNNSIFAHGFSPITAEKYEKTSRAIISFIRNGIELVCNKKLDCPQFPCNLILEGT